MQSKPPELPVARRECRRMPEALDDILLEDIPGLPEDLRKSLRFVLGHLDGSGPQRGMTCIDKEDIPTLKRKIFHGLDEQYFEYDPKLLYQKSLRHLMHSLDRSCHECSRTDCENRVELTRIELLEVIFFDKSPDYRRVKTDPDFAGKGLKPA